MNKVLVQYRLNCHYGDIEGIFVSTHEELEVSYGETAMFGDVLGKHSEVWDFLGKDSYKILSEDPKEIEMFVKLVGDEFGYNPLDFIPKREG